MASTGGASRGKRINIDLNEASVEALDGLRALTNLSTAELFRHAFVLLRLYIQAKRDGCEICISNPKGRDKLIELPIVFREIKEATEWQNAPTKSTKKALS